MKLLESDERYMLECCQYRIHVDNGVATVTCKDDKERAWFIPFWVGLTRVRLEAKYCPECGTGIPKVKEEKDEKRFIATVDNVLATASGVCNTDLDGDAGRRTGD